MLEPHAPHEPIHTWKGFFVHLATIVVGLLIAVGLERAVEYGHHRQQLSEAREELAREIRDNESVLAKNKVKLTSFKNALDANMALLRAAQSSDAPVVANLEYEWLGEFFWPPNGSWQALRQNGALNRMAHQELGRYTYFYAGVDVFQESAKALSVQLDMAAAIARRSAGGVLLPTDIQELIVATSECQGRLAYLMKILRLEELGLKQLSAPSSREPQPSGSPEAGARG